MHNGTDERKNMPNEDRITELEAEAEQKAREAGDEAHQKTVELTKELRKYMEAEMKDVKGSLSEINDKIPNNLSKMATDYEKQQIIDEHHKKSVSKWRNILGLVAVGAAVASIGWGVFVFAVNQVTKTYEE